MADRPNSYGVVLCEDSLGVFTQHAAVGQSIDLPHYPAATCSIRFQGIERGQMHAVNEPRRQTVHGEDFDRELTDEECAERAASLGIVDIDAARAALAWHRAPSRSCSRSWTSAMTDAASVQAQPDAAIAGTTTRRTT
ncbi:hypothetical protein [Mycobacteroides chelonae]|uniref:hypothetical protein n=1 Tax=Mycobacteroides chelonae TaxID=1774 RepID=UPI0010427D65|nr:hypothetical protein [Mycobacteroides chelonae]MBF9326977.1 hypothetical protein [Mycobacteroides chelonae]MBF9421154.1 hypothetical protein [Mycobacteroides chelonae]MBF9436655.1 hypothetical protein [Mycobacteroides chelonae]MBV6361056.1 hypothetical protein [Mycobacteroides chelonae]MEC4833436.1 hypothetical protein [Mycobacteroides chelonae]